MIRLFVSFLALAASAAMAAHDHDGVAGASTPAPIGVMGEHMHRQGDVMFSYRYMAMTMQGSRTGGGRVSTDAVLDDFMVAPTRMHMNMHMLGAMYAPSDSLALMAMFPYTQLAMDHRTRAGVLFTTHSEGFCDIRLAGLVRLSESDNSRMHAQLGVSLPSGSINVRDDTPSGPRQKLPYPMQLGSGTFDLLPGITLTGNGHAVSWGAQLQAVVRLGKNSNNYTLGDHWRATAWLARDIAPGWSLSGRILGERWGNIDGADAELNPAMSPSADPKRRRGQRIDIAFGASYGHTRGTQRFGIEVAAPAYQYLEGPQLETDWRIVAGWQYIR